MVNLNEYLFLIAVAAWLGWVLFKRYINADLDRHKTSDPPTDAQIRWHIWNIRKDVSMIAVTNFAILLVLVYALVLRL